MIIQFFYLLWIFHWHIFPLLQSILSFFIRISYCSMFQTFLYCFIRVSYHSLFQSILYCSIRVSYHSKLQTILYCSIRVSYHSKLQTILCCSIRVLYHSKLHFSMPWFPWMLSQFTSKSGSLNRPSWQHRLNKVSLFVLFMAKLTQFPSLQSWLRQLKRRFLQLSWVLCWKAHLLWLKHLKAIDGVE